MTERKEFPADFVVHESYASTYKVMPAMFILGVLNTSTSERMFLCNRDITSNKGGRLVGNPDAARMWVSLEKAQEEGQACWELLKPLMGAHHFAVIYEVSFLSDGTSKLRRVAIYNGVDECFQPSEVVEIGQGKKS